MLLKFLAFLWCIAPPKLESFYGFHLFLVKIFVKSLFTYLELVFKFFDWFQCTRPWFDELSSKILIDINMLVSPSLEYISWQRYQHARLGMFICNYHQFMYFFSSSVGSIEVEEVCSSGSVYVQSDGEHLGFLPRKFHIVPAAIEMICWMWASF